MAKNIGNANVEKNEGSRLQQLNNEILGRGTIPELPDLSMSNVDPENHPASPDYNSIPDDLKEFHNKQQIKSNLELARREDLKKKEVERQRAKYSQGVTSRQPINPEGYLEHYDDIQERKKSVMNNLRKSERRKREKDILSTISPVVDPSTVPHAPAPPLLDEVNQLIQDIDNGKVSFRGSKKVPDRFKELKNQGAFDKPKSKDKRDPMSSTAYVDTDSGEIVDTTNNKKRGRSVRSKATEEQKQAQAQGVPSSDASAAFSGTQDKSKPPKDTKSNNRPNQIYDEDRLFLPFEVDEEDSIGKSPQKVFEDELELTISERESRMDETHPDRVSVDDYYTSFEDYEKGIDPESKTRREEAERNLAEQRKEMQDTYINPERLKIEGEEYESLGEGVFVRKFPKPIQHHINIIRKMYKCSISDVMRLVIMRGGIGIDSDGNIVNVDHEKYHIKQSEFIALCMEIEASQKKYGHPLGIVGDNVRIGGTRCFPIGVLPSDLAKSLTMNNGSVLHETSVADLIKNVGETWRRNTQPTIMANTTGDRINQRYALFNMARAYAELDGQDVSHWGVPNSIERTIADFIDESDALKSIDEDLVDVMDYRDQMAQKAIAKMRARYMRETVNKDENGNILSLSYSSKRTTAGKGLLAMGNYMRWAGVFANPMLIISGYAEHITGEIATWEANHVFSAWTGVTDDYKPTQFIRSSMRSREATEALAVLSVLYNVGGMDAIKGYSALGKPITKADAQAFLNEYVRGIKEPGKLKKALQEMNRWSSVLMPGDAGMRGFDAQRLAEMFLINMSNNSNIMNASNLEEAIRRSGAGRAVMDMMLTNEGRDAFISMSNLNLGRKSPLSYQIDKLMRKNGLTNFLITVGLDTYVTYGVNLVQNIMPFTNTMSYLAVRKANGEARFSEELLENQLGGLDENFLNGLSKNIIYDSMKFGNFALISLLSYMVIQSLGFEDPDEDDDIFNWLAYKIGGEKYVPAWWMNDLVGWGLPMGVAMAVYDKHPEDPMRAVGVFWSGCYSMLQGSSVLDACELITHQQENLVAIEQSMSEDAYDAPDNWFSWGCMAAEGFLATTLSKMTPGVIKNYAPVSSRNTFIVGENARDHTASKIYDRSSDESIEQGKTKGVDSYQELRRRALSKMNPLYALFNNVTKNGYLFDDGTTDKTGYLFTEMPIATKKDPVRSAYMAKKEIDPDNPTLPSFEEDPGYWMDSLEFDPEDPNLPQEKEERAAWMESHASNLIQMIENTWNSPEEALANGFLIPYNARKNAIDYCFDQILMLDVNYVMNAANGMYPDFDSSKAATTRIQEQKKYYWDLLNNWFQNEDIPWSDAGYEKLLSDWDITYRWKEGNRPATGWDYLANGGAVEKVYEPMGNHPNDFLPFTIVEQKDRGYNQETIPNWYVEGLTNTEKIFENNKGRTAKFGEDENEYLNDIYFGAQGDHLTETGEYNIPIDGVPTIDKRSYVASEKSLPDSLKNYKIEDRAKELGIDLDELNEAVKNGYKNGGGTNNYKAYSKTIGGTGRPRNNYGSSPRIYSNTRSLNADRASTMSARTPYNANRNYLNPNFETKGSREAYKRSDI